MHIKFVTIHSYEEYLKKVVADVAEKNIFVNLLTTNLTFFFREPDAFEFLKDKVSSKFEGKTFTVSVAAAEASAAVDLQMTFRAAVFFAAVSV